MRDEFSKKTKDTLAKRVNYLCSNPKCGRLTIGPSEDETKSILVGVAAHICAAAKNGPRYNSELSMSERTSVNNGIWLCSYCSVLIDKEESYFTVEKIREWKNTTENLVKTSLIANNSSQKDKNVDLFNLMSKLISIFNVSELLPDLFLIGLKYNLEDLKEISTRELNGYYAIDLPPLNQLEKFDYRIASVLVTSHELDFNINGFASAEQVLRQIKSSNFGYEQKYLFHMPLRDLETYRQSGNGEKLIFQVLDSDFLTSSDGIKFNESKKIWFKSSIIESIITNVRNRITRILTAELLNDHA